MSGLLDPQHGTGLLIIPDEGTASFHVRGIAFSFLNKASATWPASARAFSTFMAFLLSRRAGTGSWQTADEHTACVDDDHVSCND